jgi:hypothetical protein
MDHCKLMGANSNKKASCDDTSLRGCSLRDSGDVLSNLRTSDSDLQFLEP